MLTHRLRPSLALAVLLAVTASLLAAVSTTATAGTDTLHSVLVDEDPVKWTPNLTGDRVVAIDTASGVVAAGGKFTAARVVNGTDQPYDNFVLFDEDSGALRAAPSFDKEVHAVEAAADGQSFYVGGRFNNVNGEKRSGLARVALDGTVMESFDVEVDWAVYDLALVGGTLYVGGNFNKVFDASGVHNRDGLVAVDAATGAVQSWNPTVTDPRSTSRTTGARSVDKLDATPNGAKLVMIGNFSKVDGHTRDQVAMFDLAGGTPTVADWYAEGFAPQCRATKWPMWIRDMDVAPTGDHVVFGTTGAYGSPTGSQRLCDTVSRYELTETGTVEPTWLSYTGGDTTYGVAATGEVVYAGGHMRWMNNPWCGDRECAGAVDRYGITALDARTGVPLEWNPTRDPRGYGTYELIADDSGLWVGQDTARIGNEYHSLIAKLPTATGRTIARPAAGDPDAGILLLDNSSTVDIADNAGAGVVGTTEVTFDPRDVRAATTVGNDLMLALDNDQLVLVGDSGTSTSTTIDLNGLNNGYFPVDSLTAMFFDEVTSTIFYTQSGSSSLRSRGYSPDSRVVEALNKTVSTSGDGFSWNDTTGAWLDGSTLYVGRNDGTLDAITWDDGAPVAGTMTTVGGPGVDGVDYDVRALTPVGTSAPAANQPPVADLTVTCDGLDCTLDASGSTDVDGTIDGFELTVDGAVVAATSVATVTVDGEGTHTFGVTVTDDDGATDATSTDLDVFAAPTPVADVSCDALTCTFDGSASTDASGAITAWAWDLGDGTTASSATVEHTYGSAGDYTATLTVTDDEGATASTTVTASPYDPVAAPTFLGDDGGNRWTATPTVTVPDVVTDGTVAILELAVNATGSAVNPPSGPGTWTELGRTDSNNSETVVWIAELSAADAGAEISVPLSRGRKTDISLLLYAGVDTSDPVVAFAATAETVEQAAHTTPTLELTEQALVVSLWTDKTASSTSWAAPAGENVRRQSNGSGGGRIGVLLTDPGSVAGPGTVGGLTATSGAADDAATMWTIALRPA